MFFQNRISWTGPLLRDLKILIFFDKSGLENYICINKSLKRLLSSVAGLKFAHLYTFSLTSA